MISSTTVSDFVSAGVAAVRTDIGARAKMTESRTTDFMALDSAMELVNILQPWPRIVHSSPAIMNSSGDWFCCCVAARGGILALKMLLLTAVTGLFCAACLAEVPKPAADKVPGLAELNRMISRFAPTTIRVDTKSLSSGDRQALAKLIQAARIVNNIYMQQLWSCDLAAMPSCRKTNPLCDAPACTMSGSTKVHGTIWRVSRPSFLEFRLANHWAPIS